MIDTSAPPTHTGDGEQEVHVAHVQPLVRGNPGNQYDQHNQSAPGAVIARSSSGSLVVTMTTKQGADCLNAESDFILKG